MPAPSPETDGLEEGASSPFQHGDAQKLSFIMRLRERGFRDTALIRAFELTPRVHFVPGRYADLARRSGAVPLGCGQMMAPPFDVARMLDALKAEKGQAVLEVGTGSGFVTALLARLGCRVVSVERYRTLAIEARGRLTALGIESDDVEILHGDGLAGFQGVTFDRILVHGCLRDWPAELLGNLGRGGRMVAAHGEPWRGVLAALTISADGERVVETGDTLSLAAPERGMAGTL